VKVFVDGLIFETIAGIGIWRQFYEIMGRLSRREAQYTLWLRGRPTKSLPTGVETLHDNSRVLAGRWNLVGRARRRWNLRVARRKVQRVDVFHSTYFTPSPAPEAAIVVTVHDMVPERLFSICGSWSLEDIALKRQAIQSATICIADSAATAHDLALFYPEVAGRIRVIHLGCDHLVASNERESTHRKAAKPASNYVLYVGARESYKNFHTLLEAMRSAAWPADLNLHIVGPPLLDHETRLIEVYGLRERVRSVGRLSDDELQDQYSAARCFVYPSLLEGFGIPVLEAQANACPVVLSDIPAFREVAGESAIFFDPRLGERLAEAVAQACEPRVRLRLLESGAENVRKFSWKVAAEKTYAVYQEAIRLGPRLAMATSHQCQ
jgi:glycosyltransferase involved in cell wall biosynthesis